MSFVEEKQLKYLVHTFGCQMNHSDSERLSGLLESYGYKATKDEDEADFIIFNTCSIKQKAEDRVLGLMKKMRKLKESNDRLLVGITGCMTRLASTRESEEKDPLLTRVDCLDLAFPIADLPKLGELLKEVDPKFAELEQKEADLENYFKIQPKYDNNFQAFIPIMSGCDKFCTYCIVPYSRGREQSRTIESIYKEACELVKNGCIEITLLGQNVNSFGMSWQDKKTNKFTYDVNPFVQLLQKLDTIEGLERLRFTSPHPQDMTEDVVKTIAEGRTLMPYIHLPLQSGSDAMLKKMNRNYNVAKFREIVEVIRRYMPDCSISTDIIVGFCGETEEMHQETCEFLREIGFDLAFISQFSPRRGTPAEMLMEDTVSREDKKRRWHEMNDILRETASNRHKYFEGKKVKVLVERFNERSGKLHGRTEHYKEVALDGDKELIGKIVEVHVDKALDWLLEGSLIGS